MVVLVDVREVPRLLGGGLREEDRARSALPRSGIARSASPRSGIARSASLYRSAILQCFDPPMFKIFFGPRAAHAGRRAAREPLRGSAAREPLRGSAARELRIT